MTGEGVKRKSTAARLIRLAIGFGVLNPIATFFAGITLLGGAVDAQLTVLKLVPVGLLLILQPWGVCLWYLTEEPTFTLVAGTLISAVVYESLSRYWSHRKQEGRTIARTDAVGDPGQDSRGFNLTRSLRRRRTLKIVSMTLCAAYLALLFARCADYPVADRGVPGGLHKCLTELEIPIQGSATREFRDFLQTTIIWCGKVSPEDAERVTIAMDVVDAPEGEVPFEFFRYRPHCWDPKPELVTWYRISRDGLGDYDGTREVFAYSESKGKLYYWCSIGF